MRRSDDHGQGRRIDVRRDRRAAHCLASPASGKRPAGRRGRPTDRRVRPEDDLVRRPRDQRSCRPVRQVPDRDCPSAAGRHGVPLDDDGVRRPPGAGPGADDRCQPVRRFPRPGAFSRGGPAAGCAHPGDHQSAGFAVGPGSRAGPRRTGRSGAGGGGDQVLHRATARALSDLRPAAGRLTGLGGSPARPGRPADRRRRRRPDAGPALSVRLPPGHDRSRLFLPDRTGGSAQADGDLLSRRAGILRLPTCCMDRWP